MMPNKSFALQWYLKCPFKNAINSLLYRNYVLPLAIEDNSTTTKFISTFFQSKYDYYYSFRFKRHIKHLAKATNLNEDVLKTYLFFEIERMYLDAGNYSDPYSLSGENDFSHNTFRDLSVLLHCKNLQALSLTDCYIEDFQPLEHLKRLKILEIRLNEKRFSKPIANISTINGLHELEYLHLEAVNIDSIAEITNENIKFLDLSGTNLSGIQEISICQQIKLLNISETPIVTLSGIEKFKNLEVLIIKDIEVVDFSPIISLKKLGYVMIHNIKPNSEQETELVKLKSALPNVKIIDTVSFNIPSILHYKEYGGHFGSRKLEMFNTLDDALNRQLKYHEQHYLWNK